MRDEKLNFAIIGCGAIGQRHAVQASLSGSLKAVCDIDGAKARALAGKYQAKSYLQMEQLLEEETIDVVAICTPNGLHAAQTIQALNKGLHVICEKPMAILVKDTIEMMRAAEKAGKHLFVVKQNRFNPPVALVKKMLEEGRLGRIYSLQMNGCWHRDNAYYQHSWHGTRDMDGGILFTQFSHFIDLLYWMFGDVTEVAAFADNFSHKEVITFEDTVAACLRFKSGILGSLHFSINSYRKNMEGSLLVIGEKGTVKIGGQYLNTLEYLEMQDKGEEMSGLGFSAPANDYGHYQGSMSNHDKMYHHVMEVITRGAPNQFTGHDGSKTVEIIEKIYTTAT